MPTVFSIFLASLKCASCKNWFIYLPRQSSVMDRSRHRWILFPPLKKKKKIMPISLLLNSCTHTMMKIGIIRWIFIWIFKSAYKSWFRKRIQTMKCVHTCTLFFARHKLLCAIVSGWLCVELITYVISFFLFFFSSLNFITQLLCALSLIKFLATIPTETKILRSLQIIILYFIWFFSF